MNPVETRLQEGSVEKGVVFSWTYKSISGGISNNRGLPMKSPDRYMKIKAKHFGGCENRTSIVETMIVEAAGSLL
jgi:hypothetical protein